MSRARTGRVLRAKRCDALPACMHAQLKRCSPASQQPFAALCHCRFGCDEALSFVFMPMGADFSERAIALATALLPAEAEAALWRTQVGAALHACIWVCRAARLR